MKHRGFEPRTTWLKVKCSTDWANTPYLTGLVGFGPTNAGVKVLCLTAWRWPIIFMSWHRMRHGTFPRLRRLLATSTLYAAVRILAERFWLYRKAISCKVKKSKINFLLFERAIDGARTRGLDLGKVARYQLRHYRTSGWWESNPRIQLGRLVFYHWTTPAW